jgi:ubiquitin-conjugating enzyme E2 Q
VTVDSCRSEPLAAVLKDQLQAVVAFRQQHPACGWAGAELACGKDSVFNANKASELEDEERGSSVKLPADPMAHPLYKQNFPLIAFSYLVRRFVLCPWFCVICHQKVQDIAVRPYVCTSALCTFQYLQMALGPSLEYEILHNTAVVDLLVSFTYVAAYEGELPDTALPPPGMQIKLPNRTIQPAVAVSEREPLKLREGETIVEMDTMTVPNQRAWMAVLIGLMPKIADMRTWLEAKDMSSEYVFPRSRLFGCRCIAGTARTARSES